jgi:putative FmdB family regulatory protein
MPLYDYKCAQCQKVIEVRHGFNDSYAEPCDACGAALKRVINPAPIIFKGSGFYVTDSRKKETASKETAPKETAPAKTESPSTPAPTSSAPSKESAA